MFTEHITGKDTYKIATDLHNRFGWNVIPMFYFQRKTDGTKKHKMINWEKYKAQPFDYENEKWLDEYKALMVITGKISNLTVLDIDSEEALKTITDSLDMELLDLSNYIVKTYKGYQLFYKYEPNLRSRLGIREHVDFLNGGVTFAVPPNKSYEIIKNDEPDLMPLELKNLISESSTPIGDTEEEFEKVLKANSTIKYANPLVFTIKKFLTSDRISSTLKDELEGVFCSKDYSHLSLKDLSQDGIRHAITMHAFAIVASNPTVNREIFDKFTEKWSSKIIKVDLKDENERAFYVNRKTGALKLWRYNDQWRRRYEESKQDFTEGINYKFWFDPDGKMYKIYNLTNGNIDNYKRVDFQEAVARIHNTSASSIYSDVELKTPEDINVTMIKEIRETFDPTVDDEFFTDEKGIEWHNNFKRTPLLTYFQTCQKSDEMPKFYEKLFNHVFPVKKERDHFLHNLAYHMTYFKKSQTMFVITGDAGTGKNTILQEILKRIYSHFHVTTKAVYLKGRFRDRLKNKLVVFVDEINESRARTGERGSFAQVMKEIIGNNSLEVEGKGVAEKEYRNHAFYCGASNQEVPYKLDEPFDRRNILVKTSPENIRELSWFPKPTESEPEAYENELDEGIHGFIEYLKSIELNHKLYGEIIDNKQRQLMLSSSIPLDHQYAEAIYDRNLEALYELNEAFANYYEQRVIREDDDLPFSVIEEYSDLALARSIKKILVEKGCSTVRKNENGSKRVHIKLAS